MSATSKNFLVICYDQQGIQLDQLATFVNTAGFTPIKISELSGLEAMLEIHLSDIASIVCNLNQPNLDELSLSECLSDERCSNIPLIFLTKDLDLHKSKRPQITDASAVLPFPPKADDLIRTLKDKTKERIEQITELRILHESFLTEAQELMEELEPLLLALESRPNDSAQIASIFRIIHTIKGASGVLAREQLTKFLHAFEDVLTQLKSGTKQATPAIVSSLLSAYDLLVKTINAIREKSSKIPNLIDATENLRQILQHEETSSIESNAQTDLLTQEPSTASNRRESVAVPTQMLDEFLYLTGETTVIRNMVNKLVRAIERQIPGDKDIELLSDLLEEMHKINATMQTKTAELRKTPLTKVVKKLPRTVRDISNQLKKSVKLVTSGENLRVDTTIAQALSNSLIHMVRNSIDHGIEAPEIRARNGKSNEGTIRLTFREIKDYVVVDVSDDGAGIDTDRIRAKLRENGHLDLSIIDSMDRDRLLKQIFEPGFSTAKTVTDVSGRGVGMDMVKTSIDQLKGRIDISSELGKGTTFKFTIPIPKSVVIINALIVLAADRIFAIPQENIIRLLRITGTNRANEINALPGAAALQLNNNLIPLVSLKSALGLGDQSLGPESSEDLNVIIVKWDGGTYGLTVDQIYDAEDIVVKSLHNCVDCVGAYAGATFLGDGSVGLIIDIAGIAKLTQQTHPSNTIRHFDVSTNEIPTQKTNLNGKSYLLFQLETSGTYAISIDYVFRLEEIPSNFICLVGDQKVIHYRGELIPYIDLSPLMANDREICSSELLKVNLLILQVNSKLYAVPIENILDIHYLDTDIVPPPTQTPWIHGLITLETKIATVVNILSVIQLKGLKENYQADIATSPPASPSTPEIVIKNEQESLGWGLF